MSVLEIEGACKSYQRSGQPPVVALDDVSIVIGDGQFFGIVGESGSGKTTLSRCIIGLESLDAGQIRLGDSQLQPTQRRRFVGRRELQLVFQDPYASLNPRMTVGGLVAEGLKVHRLRTTAAARRERVGQLLELVGLDPRHADTYLASLSGGQRQRVAIARALSVEPAVLVCDEPVSALDVSVQAQVLNLLRTMQRELGLTVVLVAHDLAVVRYVCDEVAVMERGRVVEQGAAADVLDRATHPYTQSLLAAVPNPNPAAARAEAAQRGRTASVSRNEVQQPMKEQLT